MYRGGITDCLPYPEVIKIALILADISYYVNPYGNSMWINALNLSYESFFYANLRALDDF